MNLVGHTSLLENLKNLFETDRLPHAILLTGPKSVGKRKIAELFARRLILGPSNEVSLMGDDNPLAFNENHPYFPQIEAGSCPDFLIIEPEEGKKQIGVEPVRHALSKLSLASEGKRVVIVDAADEMNNNAANALLKTLEEPGEGVHLILVAHSLSKLLPTIVSRCRQFKVSPLSQTQVLDVLKQENTSDDMALLEKFSALAGGCPGEAIKQINEGAEIFPIIQSFMDNIDKQNHFTASQLAEKISAKKAVPLAMDMLLGQLAQKAKKQANLQASQVYSVVQKRLIEMNIYNINAQLTLETALNDVMNAEIS